MRFIMGKNPTGLSLYANLNFYANSIILRKDPVKGATESNFIGKTPSIRNQVFIIMTMWRPRVEVHG
jgi:hypothetical protein